MAKVKTTNQEFPIPLPGLRWTMTVKKRKSSAIHVCGGCSLATSRLSPMPSLPMRRRAKKRLCG